MKKIKILLLFCGFGICTFGQNCTCQELLDSLIKKVKTDYAGYIHKVKEPSNLLYKKFERILKLKSENTTYTDCYDILESYTGFFNDGHLFIAEFPEESALQSDSLRHLIKHLDIPANYADLLMKRGSKDSIEGVWRDGLNQQIVVVHKSENLFYGIIQQSPISGWEPGMVKMEIKRIKRDQYNVLYFRNDFAKIHFRNVHIYKNVFFPFGVYRLAKIFPHDPEISYVDLADPNLPVIRIIDPKNILLTIPSALINGNYLDSLLTKYDTVIKTTPDLIIDIRGNTGGSYIWGRLYDIANTIIYPSFKKTNADDFLMLASNDDAEYVKDRIASNYDKSDTAALAFYDDLITRIRTNSGKIIGFSYYTPGPDTAKRIVYKYPARISLIIDKGVASAAEAFIMGLKETSSKITLYGNNTYGMIDYMNVNTIPFGGNRNNLYYFGYPTFFSKDIKTHPINPTGIKPDIYIRRGIKDWIHYVVLDFNEKYKG